MIDAFLGEGSQRAVVEKKENANNQAIEPIAEKEENGCNNKEEEEEEEEEEDQQQHDSNGPQTKE